MRASASGAMRSLCVLGLVLACVASAAAKDGRDFMAYYSIEHASATGNNVELTLQLKLFNYSGADIQYGAVALYNSEPTSSPLGGFSAIKLFRARHDVDLTQQFTVPKREFERWQNGAHPALFLLYKNAQGRVLKSHIDLVRRPSPPLAQQGQ